MQSIFPFFLFLLCSTLAASQTDDYWVDPVLGSDSNTGTDPGSPFQTLTWALETVRQTTLDPSHTPTVFLQPGHYDPSTGEAFPINPFAGANIVGLGGPEQTVFSAPFSTEIFRAIQQCVDSSPNGISCSIEHPSVEISGVTLRECSRAFTLRADPGPNGFQPELSLTLSNSIIRECTLGMDANAFVRIEATDVQVLSNFHGVNVAARHGNWTSCTFEDNRIGIILGGGTFDTTSATFTRCKVTKNNWGVLGIIGLNGVTFESCLVTQNFFGGFDVSCSKTEDPLIQIIGCTIALNGGQGLRTNNGIGVSMRDSIVAFNADDIDAPTGLTNPNHYSNNIISLGDPDAAVLNSMNCNRFGDPLFRDLLFGDFRLLPGSDGIDSASCLPGSPIGSDLHGIPRNIDGDLDGIRAQDIGAFEYRPFEVLNEAQIGMPLNFHVDGIPGTMGILVCSPTALTSAPTNTVYGELWLDPTMAMRHIKFTMGKKGFETLSLPIPNDPNLVGQTWGFQVWRSLPNGTAPAVGTFMNPLEVLIQ